MDSNFAGRLRVQNMTAAMMKEMPKSRHNYKAEGLPLEGPDPAFTVPVDFEKILNTLWHDLQKLESHAIIANRYSEKYLSISRELELMIRKVGSLCITKAVMEQQGSVFNTPEDLTIPRLTFMAGYHFNKAHAAADGTHLANLRFYLGMLEQETRWASLICRLQATDDKIRLIREGKLEIRIVPEEETAESSGKKTAHGKARSDESTQVKAAMPAALPVDMDLVRSAAGSDVRIAAPAKAGKPETEAGSAAGAGENTQTKAEASQTAAGSEGSIESETKTSEKVSGPAVTGNTEAGDKTGSLPDSEEKVPETAEAPEETAPEETKSKISYLDRLREEFRREREKVKAETGTETSPERAAEEKKMQNILMYAAVRSADRKAYEAALRTRGPELDEMWQRFLQEDARKGFPILRGIEMSGIEKPPDEEDDWEDSDAWEYAPMEEMYV